MAATFEYNIDKNTQAAIAADANLIQKSAGERIREELFKILQCTESHSYLSMMTHSDLLFSVFPEFLKLRQLRLQSTAPRTLFDQTLDSYNHLEKLLNPEDEFKRYDDADRSILMKWAMLFHDIDGLPAKPPLGNGKINNPDDSANQSAAKAQGIFRRLRFSRRQSEAIEMIIRHHFKPMILFSEHQKNAPVEKGFIRLFLKCKDVTPDVLLHALAEFRGQREADDPVIDEFTSFIRKLIRKYDTVLRPRALLPPPVNGNDLISEFGMKPSAEFKHILNRVEEERLSQPTYSREEALKLVEELLRQR